MSLWLFQIGFCNVLGCQRWCIHSYSLRSMCLYRSGLFSTACTINSYLYPFLQTKYRERVLGLILVSPLYKTPSWTEWFYNKVAIQYIATSTQFLSYRTTRYIDKFILLIRLYWQIHFLSWCQICCIITGCVTWWRTVCCSGILARYEYSRHMIYCIFLDYLLFTKLHIERFCFNFLSSESAGRLCCARIWYYAGV
jgi:hypothetical protein